MRGDAEDLHLNIELGLFATGDAERTSGLFFASGSSFTLRFRKCATVPWSIQSATLALPCLALRPRLEVIDDQRRLLLAVDVETCTFATHVDLDLRPHARHEVDVRFVLGRKLLAKPE